MKDELASNPENEIQTKSSEGPTRFDEIVTAGTQALAKTTSSRRSFLALVGKSALALAGVAILNVLPINRQTRKAEATASNCNDWYMCYIATDRTCLDACGSNSCPTGSQQRFAWTGCCWNGSNHQTVYYYDCCVTDGNPCCDDTGYGCQQPPLHVEPYWCNLNGVGGTLCCTKWVLGSPC
jgi:hypothetical protein